MMTNLQQGMVLQKCMSTVIFLSYISIAVDFLLFSLRHFLHLENVNAFISFVFCLFEGVN